MKIKAKKFKPSGLWGVYFNDTCMNYGLTIKEARLIIAGATSALRVYNPAIEIESEYPDEWYLEDR